MDNFGESDLRYIYASDNFDDEYDLDYNDSIIFKSGDKSTCFLKGTTSSECN